MEKAISYLDLPDLYLLRLISGPGPPRMTLKGGLRSTSTSHPPDACGCSSGRMMGRMVQSNFGGGDTTESSKHLNSATSRLMRLYLFHVLFFPSSQ